MDSMGYDASYPRSEDAYLQDCTTILGWQEVQSVLERTPEAVHKWKQFRKLPAADGPLVHGKATWKRSTILAWAHREHDFTTDKHGHKLACFDEAARWVEVTPHSQTVDWCDRDD